MTTKVKFAELPVNVRISFIVIVIALVSIAFQGIIIDFIMKAESSWYMNFILCIGTLFVIKERKQNTFFLALILLLVVPLYRIVRLAVLNELPAEYMVSMFYWPITNYVILIFAGGLLALPKSWAFYKIQS